MELALQAILPEEANREEGSIGCFYIRTYIHPLPKERLAQEEDLFNTVVPSAHESWPDPLRLMSVVAVEYLASESTSVHLCT